MTVRFIGKEAFPTYMAQSTDMNLSGSLVSGTPLLGKTIYLTDTQDWYIVVEASGSSYKVEPFVMPALET